MATFTSDAGGCPVIGGIFVFLLEMGASVNPPCPKATFPTLSSHEGPAADACTLIGNTRHIAWT